MGDVLSQDEVDALLSGLTGGEIEAETDSGVGTDGEPSASSFDFTNQDRIVRGRLPTLEMVHERFTRLFRQSISNAMQCIVDVNMLNTDMGKFGEFMRGQAIPSSYHIFRMDPLKGSGLLVLEGKLIFTMVNNFFGGKGASYFKMEGRDFTPIENKLISSVVQLIFEDYAEGWAPVQKLQITQLRNEVNPQFVSIVPPSDAVWVIEIEMSFEDISEKMYFCLPYSTLEPMKDKLKARYQSESMESENTWVDRISDGLNAVPLEIRVQLGTAHATGREILSYKPGDVIQLREHSNTPLNIYIEGVLKMRGVPGSTQGAKAIHISQIMEPLLKSIE